MKLAFCIFKYFPYGGLQRDFRAIVEVCLARGHSIDVYTLEWLGEKISDVNITILKDNSLSNYQKYLNFSSFAENTLSRQNYDVIVGFNKMAGLDIYYAADSCYAETAQKLKSFFYRLTNRYKGFLKLESAVFASSRDVDVIGISKAQIEEFHYHYPILKEKLHLMLPWLNVDRFPPSNVAEIRRELRKTFELGEEDLLLLFVGSGFKTKGLDRALLAIASLPPELKQKITFMIIGHDKYDHYQRMANTLGIANRVKYLGGRSDVPDFMFSADLLFHPAYRESAGYVLIEALVAGLPVLTTDSCGFAPYILEAKAGQVLSSPFNQDECNALLKKMLLQRDESYSKNGKAFALGRDLTKTPNVIADLIEKKAHHKRSTNQILLCNTRTSSYIIYPEMRLLFKDRAIFSKAMALEGNIYRFVQNRKTLAFEHQGEVYFAKLHLGIGWLEILKYFSKGRMPIFSAKNEYRAIKFLQKLSLATLEVVAFGEKGLNPAKKQSFLITKALKNTVSLEELLRDWQSYHFPKTLKIRILKKVAEIASKMHYHGMNHCDFYACHFLFDLPEYKHNDQIKIYLIDLHRAQISKNLKVRWKIKDIGSLYYSVKKYLSPREELRFMRIYAHKNLHRVFAEDKDFWDAIKEKAIRLDKRTYKFQRFNHEVHRT